MRVLVVVGGTFHDFDVAGKLLGEMFADHAVEFGTSYELDSEPDLLVSYTCDGVPDVQGAVALEQWVSNGGRWLALHSTNANPMSWNDYERPEDASPVYFGLLGSVCLGHPEIQPFEVRADAAAGVKLGDYEAYDEPYRIRLIGESEVLQWDVQTADEPLPIAYLKSVGQGLVAYHALGHVDLDRTERPAANCSWNLPAFHDDIQTLVKALTS